MRQNGETRALCLAIFLPMALLHGQYLARDWPIYGGDAAGTRYSTLQQINRTNVARLKVAWTYDTGDGAHDTETQPIVVDGVLYGISGTQDPFALDAGTGKLLWRHHWDLSGGGANRGVTYWTNGKDRRIFASIWSFIYALDARTGQVIHSFGRDGRVDLREDLGRDPVAQYITLTTPGVIYKNLLIVGSKMGEELPVPPGDIRAYDVRTGKLRWMFHTIPHPGEAGYKTWPKDAWTYIGAANNWAGMAVDTARGVVYVPTGSAAEDTNGANRLGDNLYANCLLALNAATGRRLWHFQGVHHDLWDRDFPSQPTLVTVVRNGQRVPAVAQTTKQGWTLLFNRVTGRSLFPMQEKKFPPSDVPGEKTAETQPIPTKPVPFARQLLTEEMLTKRTPEAHRWVVERFRKYRSQGLYFPSTVGRETVLFPGWDGGAEWGGSAFDPQSGLLYVNANDVPGICSLVEVARGNSSRDLYRQKCGSCHRDDLAGTPPQVPSLLEYRRTATASRLSNTIRRGGNRMPGFPGLTGEEVTGLTEYVLTGRSKLLPGPALSPPMPPLPIDLKYHFTGFIHFVDPEGYPAVEPPWGTLNAINLNTGEYAWRIPFGEYPELAAAGMKNTGTENYGGPIVTAGGLVFIAATNFDKKFRSFDKDTGKLLWETTLPLGADATPATYEVHGRQYVVIFATDGKNRKNTKSGVYVAFALP